MKSLKLSRTWHESCHCAASQPVACSYVHTWTVDGSSLDLMTNYEQGYSMAKKPIE